LEEKDAGPQRREAAVGSGITALPFGKPFSAMALKIAADIEIWLCGWMTAAIATCQGLTPAASSALGFLFVRPTHHRQLTHAR
jgi:hypothetical protein